MEAFWNSANFEVQTNILGESQPVAVESLLNSLQIHDLCVAVSMHKIA